MKYYTCFLYKDKSPKELHCTHKYFGTLTDEQVSLTISIIEQNVFFNLQPVPFVIPDMFGAKFDTRVLKPKKPYPLLLPELKAQLDLFKQDQYKDYRPHVTCTLDSISEPFDRYALVGSGGVIIREWKL